MLNAQTKIHLFTSQTSSHVVTTPSSYNLKPVIIDKLSLEETVYHQCLHIFYNFDEKYLKWNKRKEDKLFQMDFSQNKHSKYASTKDTP